jgi:hypothetical protein
MQRGFTCDDAGDWYCERTGKQTIKGLHDTPDHDRHGFPAVLGFYCHVHAPVHIMDKASDVEAIPRLTVEDLTAEALIPMGKSSERSALGTIGADRLTDSILIGIGDRK